MSNSYHLDAMMTAEQRQDRLQVAQTKLLLEQAGVDQHGWLRRQLCELACAMGHLLVKVGETMICRAAERLTSPSIPQQMTSAAADR
jgi:hypothetical protein